jgi:hypothetical protein
MAKAAFKNTRKRTLFTRKIKLNFKEETIPLLHLQRSFFILLKLGHLKSISNSSSDLKCDAGEGWRRPAGTIV